jgi:hypothetical protein
MVRRLGFVFERNVVPKQVGVAPVQSKILWAVGSLSVVRALGVISTPPRPSPPGIPTPQAPGPQVPPLLATCGS